MKMNTLAAAISLASLASAPVYAEPTVELSGVVEVELGQVDDKIAAPDDVKTTDIAVATVELAIDAKISDKVEANVILLYEEDDTDLNVDEATITMHLNDNLDFVIGQTVVPFGKFDSNMVSDPMTVDLGETGETALMLSGSYDSGLYWSIYTFNGDINETGAPTGEDQDLASGINIGFSQEDAFDFGIGLITNIADSDGLTDLGGSATVDSFVSGINVYGAWMQGPLSIYGEYVAADTFETADLAGFNANNEEPSALNLEIGYEIEENLSVAIAFQQTDTAAGIFPETGIGIALHTELVEGASLSFEIATVDDYGTTDGGTGETADSFTVQVATEF